MRKFKLLLIFILQFSLSNALADDVFSIKKSFVYNAIIKTGFIARDSGKELTSDYLASCVKEQTNVFMSFDCDDVISEISTRVLLSTKGEYFIYVDADGISVENRLLFKIIDSKLVKIGDPLAEVISGDVVVEMFNNTFPKIKTSLENIQKSAHSRFRIELPKKVGLPITILSGYSNDPDLINKPIGSVKWSGSAVYLLKP